MLTINSSKISAESKGIAVSRIFSIHKLPFMASQKKKYSKWQNQCKLCYGVPQRKGNKGHLIPHAHLKHSSQLLITHTMATNIKLEWLDHQLLCWDLAMSLYFDTFNRPRVKTVFLTKSGPPVLKDLWTTSPYSTVHVHCEASGILDSWGHIRQACLILSKRTQHHNMNWRVGIWITECSGCLILLHFH